MAIWKNLWRTNNLEQYRGRSNGGDDVEGKEQEVEGNEDEDQAAKRWRRMSSYPKVLITVRSELLSSNKEYGRSFLPVEPHDHRKDDDRQAKKFFQVGDSHNCRFR